MPRISVVIPAYNCERFIKDAIESVLNQTFNDYEIIVIDDGSTDKTKDAVLQFREKVKYVYQPNGGPASARNTGAALSQGEYIAFLDSDDAWLPEKLELQIEKFKNRPGLGLVYSDAYILPENFNNSEPAKVKTVFGLRHPKKGHVLNDLLLENFIPTSSVMITKVCFQNVGPFNPKLSPIEDYDRWLHIADRYEMDYIGSPLVKYRDHISTFRKDEFVTLNNIVNTLNGALGEFSDIESRVRSQVLKKISKIYISIGSRYFLKKDFKLASNNFSLSIKSYKSPLVFLNIFFVCFVDILKDVFLYLKSVLK